MSRWYVWLVIMAILVTCKFLGVGDGSVLKEAFWAGIALANHWVANRYPS